MRKPMLFVWGLLWQLTITVHICSAAEVHQRPRMVQEAQCAAQARTEFRLQDWDPNVSFSGSHYSVGRDECLVSITANLPGGADSVMVEDAFSGVTVGTFQEVVGVGSAKPAKDTQCIYDHQVFDSKNLQDWTKCIIAVLRLMED